jgi:hypothetical protein
MKKKLYEYPIEKVYSLLVTENIPNDFNGIKISIIIFRVEKNKYHSECLEFSIGAVGKSTNESFKKLKKKIEKYINNIANEELKVREKVYWKKFYNVAIEDKEKEICKHINAFINKSISYQKILKDYNLTYEDVQKALLECNEYLKQLKNCGKGFKITPDKNNYNIIKSDYVPFKSFSEFMKDKK